MTEAQVCTPSWGADNAQFCHCSTCVEQKGGSFLLNRTGVTGIYVFKELSAMEIASCGYGMMFGSLFSIRGNSTRQHYCVCRKTVFCDKHVRHEYWCCHRCQLCTLLAT